MANSTIGLDPNIAIQMVGNYATNYIPAIKMDETIATMRQPANQGDSRSIWFSINKLQAFFTQVQNLTNTNFNNPGWELGIRFYFAQYPGTNDPCWGKTLPTHCQQYAGMHTLIMVPTYNVNTANPDYVLTDNIDFDPNFNDGNGMPLNWSSIYSGKNAPVMLTMMNEGGLMPPPWPETDPLTGEETEGVNEFFMNYVDMVNQTVAP